MGTRSKLAALAGAASLNGWEAERIEVVRDGSHLIARVGATLVARVGDPGTLEEAAREVKVSRWLRRNGMPVVEAAQHVVQPTVVSQYPVTWWKPVEEYRRARPDEVATILRQLHQLPIPEDPHLPPLAPLDRALERLSGTHVLSADDKTWLTQKVQGLRSAFREAMRRSQPRVLHGDAWQGNVIVTPSQRAVLLDLESVCTGPWEWDLIAIAADYTDFARISVEEYDAFAKAYGHDVTNSTDFHTMANIQELRWTLYVLDKAADDPAAAREVAHRVACLRGEVGKPWRWSAF